MAEVDRGPLVEVELQDHYFQTHCALVPAVAFDADASYEDFAALTSFPCEDSLDPSKMVKRKSMIYDFKEHKSIISGGKYISSIALNL